MSVRENRHSSLAWRKSSRSSTGECVEIAQGKLAVMVRDTGHRSGAVLAFKPDKWSAFVRRVRADD